MRFSLKYLILLVALLSLVLTLASSIISGYRVEQEALIDNTLKTNEAYARKLAETTGSYLHDVFQSLQASADYIQPYMSEAYADNILLHEADRLRKQSNTFNSVAIIEKTGEILATSPQTLELIGEQLNSEGGIQALKERKPFISQPYVGMTGRLILIISYPVFNSSDNYLGLIAGTIYLKEKNALQNVLGEHFYEDGSYVYVVDKSGRIIYHQDPKRIDDVVLENPVVKKSLAGNSGSMEVTNTENIEMIAGYAPVPIADWGIVSQRSKKATLQPSVFMVKEMIWKALPFLIFSFFIILYISNQIARPLRQLSIYAESSTKHSQEEKINSVRAWYYEAIQLKKALNYSLNFFQDQVSHFVHQSMTDTLTKLPNRRTMDAYLQKWTKEERPYALLIFDIDHFKRINDTYGHAMGDEVLKYISSKVLEMMREPDICCRFGGEEFVILLPETDRQLSFQIAESLRKKIESDVSPCGEVVTISIGVVVSPDHGRNSAQLLELADQSLYKAKNLGRNRTVVYG